VRRRLLRKHILRPVLVLRGRKFVFRAKAEAYRRARWYAGATVADHKGN
jgi:hypothetical protein